MRFSTLLSCVVWVTAAGCRCNTGGPVTNAPEVVSTPTALSFEACPTRDESNRPVADVFPDERKLVLDNNGRAPAALTFTITGADQAAFTLPTRPESLESGGNLEVPVRFAPARKGESKADLTIEDGDDSTPPLTVALVGSGANLPSQPSLKAEVAQQADGTQFSDCVEGLLCRQQFPSTLFGESVVRTVRITNLGCPALKITGIEVVPRPGADNLAFFIEEPAVVPTEASPTVLTTSGGNATLTIAVRFRPEDDNSGDTQRDATLQLNTNDPNYPQFELSLEAEAIKPNLYSVPSVCDFADPADACGGATKVANRSTFRITNGGTAPIVIDGFTFENGGRNGRFAVTVDPKGQTLIPSGQATLEVTHTDQPLYVQDVLVVSSKFVGGADGSAGRTRIGLAGGTKPCLSTDPDTQVDFNDPPTELSTSPVKIKNGAGCGDLIIDAVEVDASPFFTLVDPKVPVGTRLAAGAETTATVQFKKPLSGGTQVGTMRVKTNDSDFGPPPFKVLALYSNSPLDQLPQAVLKGCLPTDPTCANGVESSISVSLSTLGANKTVIMNGQASSDPGNPTQPGISNYQFRLVTKPANAPTAVLEANGVKQANDQVVLTLDNVATGLYRVTLTVFDDKNQQSPIPSELKINVAP